MAGVPRNYVPVAKDTIRDFNEAEFMQALRDGRSYASTGPLLDVRLGDVGIGGRFTGEAGELVVQVSSASWVPVAELRVYVDGALAAQRRIERGQSARVPLRFVADAFVTVEVEGPPEGAFAALLPGVTPFAFTNPIFVDADADGEWTALGFRSDLPATVTDPASAP